MARPRKPRHADPWADAVEHLRRANHPEWPSLIERIGPCQLRPKPDRFDTLVRAIVGQQLSTKVAIRNRPQSVYASLAMASSSDDSPSYQSDYQTGF